jgi:hypothetical protein
LAHPDYLFASLLAQICEDLAILNGHGKPAVHAHWSVLKPGGVIAGPLAETLRADQLGQDALDWVKTNFYKTELGPRGGPARAHRRPAQQPACRTRRAPRHRR